MSRPALQVLPSPATADDLMLPGHGNTVLSCLLNQPAATEELYDLSRDDFIAPTQKIIFDAIADVHGAGTPVNILSVTDRLRAKGQLEQVGGAAQLTSISLEPYTPGIVQYALTELRDASKERQAAKIGEQLQNREIQARQAIERLEKLDEGTVGDFPIMLWRVHLLLLDGIYQLHRRGRREWPLRRPTSRISIYRKAKWQGY